MKNPFKATYGHYVDVESRLQRIKEMDIRKLRAVLALPKNQVQMTVLDAAERRLRKLLKERGQR